MPPNPHLGSSLDDHLREEGTLEEFQAVTIKEVIAWQLDQAMKDRKLTKTKLAELMHTSRTQVRRMLDPKDGASPNTPPRGSTTSCRGTGNPSKPSSPPREPRRRLYAVLTACLQFNDQAVAEVIELKEGGNRAPVRE